MKTKKSLEDRKEQAVYGCFFGLILFASAAVCLSFQRNAASVVEILPFIPVALVVYLLVGYLLIWLHDRPESGKASMWFKGSAAVYWTWILTGAIGMVAFLLPKIVRNMILVNVAVIIICWILDYCSIIKIAKELNGGVVKGRYLVVDIEACPRNVEAFCKEIEDYCSKNRLHLEFITRGKPAEISMDGERYQVELDSFYSQFGPMYALKFKLLS